MSQTCLSHHLTPSARSACESVRQRLESSGDGEALALLDAMSQFPLGRFLIEHRGLNGYWTSYVITRGQGPLFGPREATAADELENWVLNRCPVLLATQERFTHFQTAIRASLDDGMHLASIPCGLMDDLLSLDYGVLQGIRLTGVDIDDESLRLAGEQAKRRGLEGYASFLKRDAWNLGEAERFDLVTSNGLNIYEPDPQREMALYRSFHAALKPGGILVTSFLTPPPGGPVPSPWTDVDADDLRRQKILFADILAVKWQVFRTEDQFRAMLGQAGFDVTAVRYDRQRMFPAVVARKV